MDAAPSVGMAAVMTKATAMTAIMTTAAETAEEMAEETTIAMVGEMAGRIMAVGQTAVEAPSFARRSIALKHVVSLQGLPLSLSCGVPVYTVGHATIRSV
jgi:hypothetical protein